MPTYVNPNKCDGCKSLDKPACMYICPSDIMHLDTSIGKAYNIEPDLCWECYACVKTCPHGKADRVIVSGTMLRTILSEGGKVPEHFSRPEVLAILREYYATLDGKVEIELHQYAKGIQ